MTSKSVRMARLPDRLDVRLALLLSVALLPVGLIAVLQSVSLLNEARARSEAALMGETLMIVQSELRLLQRGQGMVATLADKLAQGEQIDTQSPTDAAITAQSCATMVPLVQAQLTPAAQVALFDAAGAPVCSTAQALDGLDGVDLLERLNGSDRPEILLTTGAAIVIAHPLTRPSARPDAAPALIGAVAVVLPHVALTALKEFPAYSMSLPLPEGQGTAIMTFNAQGEVLTSSAGLEGAELLLPRHRALKALVGGRPLAFTAESMLGTQRVYSVVPLIDQNLYALGTWPGEGNRVAALDAVPAAVFPGLMWAASLIVAWLAAGQLVTRHIRTLRGAIAAFAGGDRAVRQIDVRGAPLELRQLSDAFVRMTDTILHDEAELENAVHQKEVLLREVHHRVKNNLQLIASILNMQLRQARSPEAKVLMQGVRDRVMSLATIHRGLYQTTGLTDIRADELMTDILRQLVKMATGPGRRFRIAQDFEPIRLTPDQAVPLSLFLTEALTNAMKYASPAEGQDMPHLSVSLTRQDEDRAILRIANSIGGKRDATEALPGGLEASTGLGAQLLEAFAQQIGGVLEHEETEDSFALTLRFDVLALRMAEARHAPTDPDAQDDDAAPGDTGQVTEPDTEDGQGKGGKTG
jgi:two-component system, sensor histidine kinase PdtaS